MNIFDRIKACLFLEKLPFCRGLAAIIANEALGAQVI
jgi:hypothetical protein